jgi:hypothetical protein
LDLSGLWSKKPGALEIRLAQVRSKIERIAPIHHRNRWAGYAAELGHEITVVKDAKAGHSEEMTHAAFEINFPNYANAIVTTSEVLESISFL